MSEDRLNLVFTALADPRRRAMLARLARGEATVNELAAPHDISLPAVSRHLKVLERAGLVTKTKAAQWRRCHLEVAPLAEADAWMAPYRRFFETRLARLEAQLETTKSQKEER
jgi:DNA-binding transcriptional ArsR family regulator